MMSLANFLKNIFCCNTSDDTAKIIKEEVYNTVETSFDLKYETSKPKNNIKVKSENLIKTLANDANINQEELRRNKKIMTNEILNNFHFMMKIINKNSNEMFYPALKSGEEETSVKLNNKKYNEMSTKTEKTNEPVFKFKKVFALCSPNVIINNKLGGKQTRIKSIKLV